MGMMVGSSLDRNVIQLKDKDGNVVGSYSVSKPKKSGKKKRLNYNHKKISRQIMMCKVSGNARRVVTRAREEVVTLLRKQMSGKYDETEVRHAIIHARKMERIARRKMKHLREEEKAKASGKCMVEKSEESRDTKELEESAGKGLSKEEMEEMLAEYEELMDELEKQNGLDEVMKEYMGASSEEMSPEQVEQLRKRHRAKELKEIVEADMKYLQAMFNKLEREKQSVSSGGVSLELEGMEIPVQVSEVPAAAVVEGEGAAVDVSV